MNYYRERQVLTEVCHYLYQRELVSAYGGNASMRVGERILITPSGFPLGFLHPEDLMLIDLKGEVVEGKYKPSSEVHLHLYIYQTRPEIYGVAHTHSPAATAFAYLEQPILPVNPESTIYLSELPIVPYHPYGTPELAEAVKDKMQGVNAVLLAKHGVVAAGKDIWAAFHLADLVEETAKINIHIQQLQR